MSSPMGVFGALLALEMGPFPGGGGDAPASSTEQGCSCAEIQNAKLPARRALSIQIKGPSRPRAGPERLPRGH